MQCSTKALGSALNKAEKKPVSVDPLLSRRLQPAGAGRPSSGQDAEDGQPTSKTESSSLSHSPQISYRNKRITESAGDQQKYPLEINIFA